MDKFINEKPEEKRKSAGYNLRWESCVRPHIKAVSYEDVDWYQWNQNRAKLWPLMIMIMSLLSCIKRGEFRDLPSFFIVPKYDFMK